MAFTKNSSLDHAERLEAFYSSQMEGYDDFRSRLLHGRESLMKALPIHEGDTLIDMGGGTGSNLDALGDKLRLLKSYRGGSLPLITQSHRKAYQSERLDKCFSCLCRCDLLQAWESTGGCDYVFLLPNHDPKLVRGNQTCHIPFKTGRDTWCG